MTGCYNLFIRNCKLFFKDKGMFFASLITPVILLVLYAAFLANVYRDSFVSALPEGFTAAEKLIGGIVGGQLVSSLLAVSCITVSFCCNMTMVLDKVTGARRDLTVSPVKKSTLALSYYLATFASTLLVCLIAAGAGFIYLAKVGWYLSFADVMLLLADIVLLVLFGTALSSIVNRFLTTQGQVSAVGTIVSSGYGFVCGAYMPIAQFSIGLQRILMFLPGTYGTSLIRNHALRGAFSAAADAGFPPEVIDAIKESIDCRLSFFGTNVSIPAMFAVVCGWTVLLIALFVLLNVISGAKHKNNHTH
ncbi:MAG TPA: ABC transporter [Clostridiales bacterium]|nr:ABC transporter [Clostridiales bacterium]